MPRPMTQPKRGDAWRGYDQAWAFLGTMVAGLVAWGGIGYVADRLLDLRWLFLPIGMVVGMAGGIWLALRKYGGPDS